MDQPNHEKQIKNAQIKYYRRYYLQTLNNLNNSYNKWIGKSPKRIYP